MQERVTASQVPLPLHRLRLKWVRSLVLRPIPYLKNLQCRHSCTVAITDRGEEAASSAKTTHCPMPSGSRNGLQLYGR